MNTSDPYESLQEMKYKLEQAKTAVNSAHKRVEDIENNFREALSVSQSVPCTVAILPSGKVAVHMWVEDGSHPNQFHIVEAGYFTEDARPRKQFPDEQLGSG